MFGVMDEVEFAQQLVLRKKRLITVAYSFLPRRRKDVEGNLSRLCTFAVKKLLCRGGDLLMSQPPNKPGIRPAQLRGSHQPSQTPTSPHSTTASIR